MGLDLNKANSIDGWMNSEELQWLYDTAAEMDSVLEIGAWCGRSTYALCSGCKGHVFSVDHFRGSPEHQNDITNGKSPVTEFHRNTKEFTNSIGIIADSQYASLWLPIWFDMLFIDGAHEYEAVLTDLAAWAGRAKKMVAGHDIGQGGVEKAARQFFPDIERGPSTIWYARRNG